MDRSIGIHLSFFKGLDKSYERPRDPDIEPEFEDSQLKSVLDAIFTVDPVSGFPKGDIQYYLSSEGNPQIKQWLENNLLKPRMVNSGSSIEGVTDDMLVEYSRQAGESVSDWQSRLTSIYDDAKSEYEKFVAEQNNFE